MVRSLIARPGGLAAAAHAAVGLQNPTHATATPTSPKAQLLDRTMFPRAYSTFAARQLTRQVSYDDPRKRPEGLRGLSPEICKHARKVNSPGSPGYELPRAASAVSCSSQKEPSFAHVQVASPQGSRPLVRRPPQAVVIHSPQRSNSVGQRSVATATVGARAWASPRSAQAPRPLGGSQSYSPPVASPTSANPFSAFVGCAGPERRAPQQSAVADRPPVSGLRPSRSRATGEHPLEGKFNFKDLEDMPEYSEPSSDLNGLLRYLDGINCDGLRITKAIYCVNAWKLYGFIPLKHHGFILYSKGSGLNGEPERGAITQDLYLTLDFSTRGILWDTFDTFPDVPEGTLFTQTFDVNLDPMQLREYCRETKPFAWPENDCKKWAKGVLLMMGIEEDPFKDEGAIDRITRGDIRMGDMCTCGNGNPGRLLGCSK